MKQDQAILLSLFCVVLAVVGRTFSKVGAAQASTEYTDWVLNERAITGLGTFGGLSALRFVAPLKPGKLSTLHPAIAASYIWAVMLSYYVFGQDITHLNRVGIFVTMFGVTLITLKGVTE